MKEQLERRLEELKAEFKQGQELIADLDKRRAGLVETVTRISGAIQVLDEEIKKAEFAPDEVDASTE